MHQCLQLYLQSTHNYQSLPLMLWHSPSYLRTKISPLSHLQCHTLATRLPAITTCLLQDGISFIYPLP